MAFALVDDAHAYRVGILSCFGCSGARPQATGTRRSRTGLSVPLHPLLLFCLLDLFGYEFVGMSCFHAGLELLPYLGWLHLQP